MVRFSPTASVSSCVSFAGADSALAALGRVGTAVNARLREWVSEADGTAAVVDERRRKLGLL